MGSGMLSKQEIGIFSGKEKSEIIPYFLRTGLHMYPIRRLFEDFQSIFRILIKPAVELFDYTVIISG